MWRDPIVDEVRKQREEYARRFDFDLDSIHRDLQVQEPASGKKVVRLQPKRVPRTTRSEISAPTIVEH